MIAVNESWRLAPWADVLYACDAAWWRLRKGVPEFKGIRVSQDAKACREFGVNHVELKLSSVQVFTDAAGVIGSGSRQGGNSGFQAVNLAVQFGATKIILIGFDMHGEHWHGRHPGGMNNPSPKNFQDWRSAFDGAGAMFKALGVDVFNCSPVSALQAYPKMDIVEALARC